jgi:hypothetical protein
MNTVLMVTAVAGTVVGNAYFDNMESCMEARKQVILQPEVTVSCVITNKKKDNSAEVLKIIADALKQAINTTQGTVDNGK